MNHPREVRPTRRQAALALTALAALTLSACGAAEEAEFEDGTTEPAPEGSASPAPDTSDDGGEDPQPEAENAPAGEVVDPGDAVSTISYTLPTDEIDGTMTVGLHHLRQRGKTMELLLTFTPEFSGSGAFSLWELQGEDHSNVGPALFDRTNLKRYDILRNGGAWDGKTVWNSKQAVHKLASGDTQAYWANFATPEDDIETINVAIPGAPEFEDVPIEQDTSADGDAATDGKE
ncbi:hypothetical protein ACT3SQ_16085 [Brachybacterium sp. AOP42-C2-15]|uniref:hypothetical protein n=1 Tax=unclassified Brachybacterium TaxID=2623841 RepID=UPI003F985814